MELTTIILQKINQLGYNLLDNWVNDEDNIFTQDYLDNWLQNNTGSRIDIYLETDSQTILLFDGTAWSNPSDDELEYKNHYFTFQDLEIYIHIN